ncbi:HK97 family phage prohead protease [Dysgonomonas sp. GY617]|uniref:HK97 family phage prohead protease n=1 Tax=Dysgonomonas sp. GY617 TaxID=2780420 RepID=UPI001883E8AC|nr:HK97 family phage prohead protease [Dysgonomonas sp. GY617]MBF0576607.1 HK97 family phage prohead protease [Dysgonomonas sp. GY617]
MDEKEKDFTISDESQINDRGFKVLLSGGIYTRFDANPVLLYDHNTEHLIGRWENRRIENGKLKATPVFDLNDSFAAEKARKVDEGFLRGASIGIRILKLEQIGDEYVVTEWELIEASITPIPSDAGAVRLYNEKREVLSFEQVKLNFNNNQSINQMADEKKTVILLSASTVASLGLKPNYDDRDIEIAVREKDDEITNLKAEIKKEKDAKIAAYLSAAQDAGKIDEKTKTNLSKLAQTDFDAVKEFIDGIESKPTQSLRDMTQRTHLSGDRANWNYLQWAKEDPQGLSAMRANSPCEFERLKQTL